MKIIWEDKNYVDDTEGTEVEWKLADATSRDTIKEYSDIEIDR